MRPAIRERFGDRREPRRGGGNAAERVLVRVMLQQRSRVESIAERIGPDGFRDPRYRAIFAALLDAGEEMSLADVAPQLDEESLAVAEELLGSGDYVLDAQRTIDDSLTRLHVREMEERLFEIDRMLPLASEKENEVLHEERQKLVVQMRASGKMRFKAFRRGRSR